MDTGPRTRNTAKPTDGHCPGMGPLCGRSSNATCKQSHACSANVARTPLSDNRHRTDTHRVLHSCTRLASPRQPRSDTHGLHGKTFRQTELCTCAPSPGISCLLRHPPAVLVFPHYAPLAIQECRWWRSVKCSDMQRGSPHHSNANESCLLFPTSRHTRHSIHLFPGSTPGPSYQHGH